MKYDFETLIDRRGTNSLKWDVKENELPMWVADMDFQTAPEIIEVLKEKVCEVFFFRQRTEAGQDNPWSAFFHLDRDRIYIECAGV